MPYCRLHHKQPQMKCKWWQQCSLSALMEAHFGTGIFCLSWMFLLPFYFWFLYLARCTFPTYFCLTWRVPNILSLYVFMASRSWNILCWNIKGINASSKCDAVRNKIEGSSCSIVCLQETKRESFDMSFIQKFAPKRICPQTLWPLWLHPFFGSLWGDSCSLA